MARPNYVTRTFLTTEATILCLDTETAEPSNITVSLAGKFKANSDILKAAKAVAETDTLKLVSVAHVDVKQALYGIPADKFIELAEILPARGTTANKANKAK